MSKRILIPIFLLVLVLVAVGCGQTSTLPDVKPGNANAAGGTPAVENPGTPETEIPQTPKEEGPKIVKIGDILAKPSDYKGQAVIVEGKIIAECGSGCWFTLNDGTGTIYVDLKPNNFVIPQKRGAMAKVSGEVVIEKGDTYIIGKKVEF